MSITLSKVKEIAKVTPWEWHVRDDDDNIEAFINGEMFTIFVELENNKVKVQKDRKENYYFDSIIEAIRWIEEG